MALNNCVLGNTTICAESPCESEVQSILSHLGVPGSSQSQSGAISTVSVSGGGQGGGVGGNNGGGGVGNSGAGGGSGGGGPASWRPPSQAAPLRSSGMYFVLCENMFS